MSSVQMYIYEATMLISPICQIIYDYANNNFYLDQKNLFDDYTRDGNPSSYTYDFTYYSLCTNLKGGHFLSFEIIEPTPEIMNCSLLFVSINGYFRILQYIENDKKLVVKSNALIYNYDFCLYDCVADANINYNKAITLLITVLEHLRLQP